MTQTADRLWRCIDFSLFPELEVLLDGRNSLRDVDLPADGPLLRASASRPRHAAPSRRTALGSGRAAMRIVSVVGTRPQLIKAAALQPVLRRDHDEIFVDTGQHYDDAMAGNFFGELGLARARTTPWASAAAATATRPAGC